MWEMPYRTQGMVWRKGSRGAADAGEFRGANTGKRLSGGGVRFLLCQFRRREEVSKALRWGDG